MKLQNLEDSIRLNMSLIREKDIYLKYFLMDEEGIIIAIADNNKDIEKEFKNVSELEEWLYEEDDFEANMGPMG